MAKLDWDKVKRQEAARRDDVRTPVFRTYVGKKAEYATECPRCHERIEIGDRIRQWVGRWVHTTCKVAR